MSSTCTTGAKNEEKVRALWRKEEAYSRNLRRSLSTTRALLDQQCSKVLVRKQCDALEEDRRLLIDTVTRLTEAIDDSSALQNKMDKLEAECAEIMIRVDRYMLPHYIRPI